MSEARRFPKLEDFERANVITMTADLLFNWARSRSIFPLGYGTACCYVELACALMSRYDMARFGWEVMRPTPRQSDLMIVAGTVNERMGPVLQRLYAQMAEPKWVVALGACAISGGVFADGYNVVNGVDKLVPVDVYIPGCPPRPEALMQGIAELQERIRETSFTPVRPTGERKATPVRRERG